MCGWSRALRAASSNNTAVRASLLERRGVEDDSSQEKPHHPHRRRVCSRLPHPAAVPTRRTPVVLTCVRDALAPVCKDQEAPSGYLAAVVGCAVEDNPICGLATYFRDGASKKTFSTSAVMPGGGDFLRDDQILTTVRPLQPGEMRVALPLPRAQSPRPTTWPAGDLAREFAPKVRPPGPMIPKFGSYGPPGRPPSAARTGQSAEASRSPVAAPRPRGQTLTTAKTPGPMEA